MERETDYSEGVTPKERPNFPIPLRSQVKAKQSAPEVTLGATCFIIHRTTAVQSSGMAPTLARSEWKQHDGATDFQIREVRHSQPLQEKGETDVSPFSACVLLIDNFREDRGPVAQLVRAHP